MALTALRDIIANTQPLGTRSGTNKWAWGGDWWGLKIRVHLDQVEISVLGGMWSVTVNIRKSLAYRFYESSPRVCDFNLRGRRTIHFIFGSCLQLHFRVWRP